MGEYGHVIAGGNVKLGTCENMYYLRADQRSSISGYEFALDVQRFRFPFPDEDTIAPGCFDDFDRSLRIPGDWSPPADFDHDGSVQFSAPPGYLLSLPCPESAAFAEAFPAFAEAFPELRMHRNGWDGGYGVIQTALRDGEWRVIVVCRSCGHRWNLPRELAETVADAFREEGEREEYRAVFDESGSIIPGEFAFQRVHSDGTFYAEMAARIVAGYVGYSARVA